MWSCSCFAGPWPEPDPLGAWAGASAVYGYGTQFHTHGVVLNAVVDFVFHARMHTNVKRIANKYGVCVKYAVAVINCSYARLRECSRHTCLGLRQSLSIANCKLTRELRHSKSPKNMHSAIVSHYVFLGQECCYEMLLHQTRKLGPTLIIKYKAIKAGCLICNLEIVDFTTFWEHLPRFSMY